MNDLSTKHVDFLNLLIRLTEKGKLSWKMSEDGIYPETNVLNYTVSIQETSNSSGSDSVLIIVRKSDGTIVDRFTDDDLTELMRSSPEVNYVRMASLYKGAVRRASGADDVLDEILDALNDEDNDVPF